MRSGTYLRSWIMDTKSKTSQIKCESRSLLLLSQPAHVRATTTTTTVYKPTSTITITIRLLLAPRRGDQARMLATSGREIRHTWVPRMFLHPRIFISNQKWSWALLYYRTYLEVDFVENSKRLKENAQSIVAHYEIWHLPQIMDNGLG